MDKLFEKEYWKSISDFRGESENLLDEFGSEISEEFAPSNMSSISRRKFLALLAASSALISTSCTDYRDKGEIIPYTKRPEGMLPGRPDYYATNLYGYSVLVKTREGRPIAIEGNPEHPISKGKIPANIHAEILGLYNPERLRHPMIKGEKRSWKEVNKTILSKLATAQKSRKKIAVLTNHITAPSFHKLLNRFARDYNADLYSFDQTYSDVKEKSWKDCFDVTDLPAVNFDKAKVIVSLESDFLGVDENAIENSRRFSLGRNIEVPQEFNRLYSIEGNYSITGMSADVRIRLRPDKQYEFAIALLYEIAKRKDKLSLLPIGLKTKIEDRGIAEFCKDNEIEFRLIKQMISDLITAGGKGIVVAGELLPKETHDIVNLINWILGSSQLFDFSYPIICKSDITTGSDFQKLLNDIKSGEIDILINLDCNPVYHLSWGKELLEGNNRLDSMITLSTMPNETTAISDVVLPSNHPLESWGDNCRRSGIYELQQPIIEPIFDTNQIEDIIISWIENRSEILREYSKWIRDYVKDNYFGSQNSLSGFESFWRQSLHDGFIDYSNGKEEVKLKFDTSILINHRFEISSNKNLSLALYPDNFIDSGRCAWNGWLHELPHPVSKITWDNYAAVSQKTAELLGVESEDVIKIEYENRNIEIPILIQPGLADDFIAIELGYGRTDSGLVCQGVGVNAGRLIKSEMLTKPLFLGNIEIVKTQKRAKLVSTQEHHSFAKHIKDLSKTRKIIREIELDSYLKGERIPLKHSDDLESITREIEYKGEKWGMTIDLNKCIGCAVCVAACNVENNIPIVGKDQVAVGREMQWIRIDRYYSGSIDNPIINNQPMLCQHCDNAPCENVCPVNATNHSPDGINQMVYNRCVGTRYCSNNCPYKVRRFNFFNFRDHFKNALMENELTGLMNNPEVTVRSRGVMEKCTFCIQRIMEARSEAIKNGEEVGKADISTACQNACPTDAIQFGNLNNRNSNVHKMNKSDLCYHVLEELHIKPNVGYLAKLRNTPTEDSN